MIFYKAPPYFSLLNSMNMDLSKKIVIEISPGEAQNLSSGLKYLNQNLLSSPENVENIPAETLKSLSWLIAFEGKLGKLISESDSPKPAPGGPRKEVKVIIR